MLAGAVAGLAAFVVAYLFGEPGIEGGIAFEEQGAHTHGGEELVSRGVQSTVGLLVGVLVWAVALGGILALVYAGTRGRIGPTRPRAAALVLAVVGFVVVVLVPFLELTSFWLVLIAAQVVLLGVFAVAVHALVPPRRNATESDLTAEPRDPYLSGHASTVVVALAVVLGGLLSAVADIGIARTFGDPVPSAAAVGLTAVAVAWPLYAFAAGPVGFLVAAVPAGAWLARRYFRRSGSYAEQVAGAYGQPDDGCAKNCRKIAAAWALARVADDAGPVVAALTAGGAGAVVVAALASGGVGSVDAGIVEGILSASTVAALVTAAGLVSLLRSAYADSDRRRAIGAVWDVGTFWPRAAHPLAPPCYAERAVPEVVDRMRVLTGHVPEDPNDTSRILVEAQLDPRRSAPPELTVSTGPVLLTGYSQGSIIAPAVVAQLPPDVLPDTALLTLACPARRLYGRAFPAFFRPDHLETLAELLTGDTTRRWTNVVRRSDYIGSWVGRSPTEPAPAQPESLAGADIRCLDPVALVPDAHPAPPPIHRHSAWWSDPQIVEPAARLVGLLERPHTPEPVTLQARAETSRA
jgi:hypothetical protein